MGPLDIVVGLDDPDVGEEGSKSADRADRKANVRVRRKNVEKERAGS